ncbi:UNVERIFIED_CONTAM: hypothetical protein Sindi_1253800 [Sesamum indicum]
MLQGVEKRYTQVEKLALALVVSAGKLRPYFQSHKIVVRTNEPLRNILSRPEASGRLIKWAVELGEFDISYQSRTAEKAQVLADFMNETSEEPPQEPGIWMLHVDGSANANNGGVGIVIEGPGGLEMEVAVRLSFTVTNNEAEYEALTLRLELAYEAGARILEAYTDSQLVVMQIQGIYEAKEKTMIAYKERAELLMQRFDKCSLQQIPRDENERADSLAKFGALLLGIKERKITVMIKKQHSISSNREMHTTETSSAWIEEIASYLREGVLPENPLKARKIRSRAPRCTLIGSQLYQRTIEGHLAKCLNEDQAAYVLREIHEGSCGNHSGARPLALKVLRQGYFWPTLVKDAREFVRACENCQRYASLIHAPATPMTPISTTCPFDQWGIDILGPLLPAKAQKKFIIVAVEYFSKWVEAEAVAKISEREMTNFIWKNIICRFGIPRVLIVPRKEGRVVSNDQTEVTNKTILHHLKTRLGSKKGWDEELPGVLWAYRTTPRSSTSETPFCLVYGSEAVIPAEIGEESQRIQKFDPQFNQTQRSFDLDMIEEKRDLAQARMMHHKSLMLRNYNKNLKTRSLQVGDLILKKVEVSRHVGKLDANWEGPYKVIEIIGSGAYKLQDMRGKNLPRPWNIQNLRKFYA